MAGVNRVDIRDPWAAIAAGTIPGAFTDGNTAFVFPPVRRHNQRGGTQTWTIRVSLFMGAAPVQFSAENIGPAPNPALPGVRAEIDVDYQTITRDADGAEVSGPPRNRPPKKVLAGKWIGSARATNAATQALLTAYSDYRKKVRAAKADVAPAAAPDAAANGPGARSHAPRPEMFYPMLLQVMGKGRASTIAPAEYTDGAIFVQTKLDGVRVIARDAESARAAGLEIPADTPVVFTSRTAKPYPGLVHIQAALAPMFAAWREHCDEPLYLDGEVFVPGLALNEISGRARGTGDDSELQYHVFDAYSPARPDAPYSVRREWVDGFFDDGEKAVDRPVQRVDPVRVASEAEVREQYARFLEAGFEGAVVRRGDRPYESGARNYHSANVLKLKPTCDAEFRVVGIGKGTGSHEGAVIWVCEVPAEKSPRHQNEKFRVGGMLGWTIPERRRVYALLSEKVRRAHDRGVERVSRFERDYPDLCLTVEFAGLSPKTGIPLQPRGIGFKRRCAIGDALPDDIPAGQDPIRLLLAEE